MSLDHESLLRLTFEIAHRAKAHGNMPVGALLAGPGVEILLEEENGYFPDLDATAHAERLLATRASKLYREPFLAQCYRPGRLWPFRTSAEGHDRGSPGQLDNGLAMPRCVFGGPEKRRGHRTLD
jgi:hypothetical protein